MQRSLGVWARAAAGWHDAQGARVARFGDNMREVAVTEGDKVEAQLRLGYAVNGYGIGDLVASIEQVADGEVDRLLEEYLDLYTIVEALQPGGDRHESLHESARIEAGLRAFLRAGNFKAFTDSFEVLHGMKQLPGMAVQRLMAEGYGFAGEGDWKTAALVRMMKVMAAGSDAGTSFMEDYTYHLATSGQKVLGSHMLEICPSIANGKPRVEIHPLGIGGKEDPVRLVFDSQTGSAINVSIMDMGNRFRMVANLVDVVPTDEPLPKLPVARALWLPQPDLKTAAAAWIHAGGAHHTGYSLALTAEHMQDYADMAGIEFLLIDSETRLNEFRKELRWNEFYYALARGL